MSSITNRFFRQTTVVVNIAAKRGLTIHHHNHAKKYLYRHAIVRAIDASLPQQAQCMDASLRSHLDLTLARQQHDELVKAISSAPGITGVTELPSDGHADSVFIEDTAVVLGDTVLFTYPGANSRQSEVQRIRETFQQRFPQMKMKEMAYGGTLDGGDVLYTGKPY